MQSRTQHVRRCLLEAVLALVSSPSPSFSLSLSSSQSVHWFLLFHFLFVSQNLVVNKVTCVKVFTGAGYSIAQGYLCVLVFCA